MKIIKSPSPNFNERPTVVDSIIIHYTDMMSAQKALEWLINPESQVSCHYLIDEEGQIYKLVEEKMRAWHAGESYWQGRTNINDCSIGIELANPGHTHGYIPFPEVQINSLINLCKEIQNRWRIPSSRILGHSDIAPQRKQDPGHLFPWEKLAKEGLGLWPTSIYSLDMKAPYMCHHPLSSSRRRGSKQCMGSRLRGNDTGGHSHKGSSTHLGIDGHSRQLNVIEVLSEIGYETTSPTHALMAFQRHFQPHKVDGIADQETYSLLYKIQA